MVFGQAVKQVLGVAAEGVLRTGPALVPVRSCDYSAGVDGRPVELGLVDPLAQMEAFEHELHARGRQCRAFLESQALQRFVHSRQLAQDGGIAVRRLTFRNLEGQTRIETLHELVAMAEI